MSHRLLYQLTIFVPTQVQNALPVAAAVLAGARAEAAIAVSLIRPLATLRLCFTSFKGRDGVFEESDFGFMG